MLTGLMYGLAATMIWGMIYIIPLMLPQYDPMLIALSRYVVFGIFSIGLIAKEIRILRLLEKKDWITAAMLGIIGSFGYYWILSEAIVRAGASVAGAFSAMIPVAASIWANATEKNPEDVVAWKRLVLPLALIICGMAMLNASEFEHLVSGGIKNSDEFWLGVFFAFVSLFIWTWYPIRNARWLVSHPKASSSAWTTAQGLMLLIPSSIGLCVYASVNPEAVPGPAPMDFLFGVLFLGIAAAWGGTLLWNQMSRRLPAVMTGQMIVFETIFAVVYAHVMRGQLPTPMMFGGMILLVSGIIAAGRIFQQKRA